MASNNENRDTLKGNGNEQRTGSKPENAGNRKLPDNPRNADESISTRNDTANGKGSRTGLRDDQVDNDETRGGR